MVQTHLPHSALSSATIPSIDALKESLVANGIEISTWGKGDAKTVEDLWEELVTGEIQLVKEPFRRILAGVVQVIIRKDGLILIDAEQIFRDGRRRSRDIPPSEKMLPGETYLDTAARCLREELGVERFRFLKDTHTRTEGTRVSWSYPGLISQYTVHTVEAIVRGLPSTDFWTTERSPVKQIVKYHHWVWKPQNGSAF